MVEQGAEQRVLQPQEEEGQNSLKQAVEGGREAKTAVNGLGTWEVEEGGSTE